MILTFDVGGTFIKWGLADEYELLKGGKIPTPLDSFDNFIKAIEKLVSKYEKSEIQGLAFSLPGTIDKETGFIRQGGNLSYNDNRHFVKELEDYFKVPVSIENDAQCAAIAEMTMGNMKDIKDGIVIVVGTGIGSSIIKDSQIYRGTHGYSGELSLALTKNFYKYGMEAFFGNQVGMKPFIQKVRNIFNDQTITGESFLRMVKENHGKAVELFDEYMNIFSQVLFSLQMFFDPKRIVIGGGISEDSFYIESLQNKFEAIFNALPITIKHADIMPCKHTNNSNLLGSLINFYQKCNIG